MSVTKLGLVAISLSIMVHAQTITFEPDASGHLPDGSLAVDDMAISNQFLRFGVLFGLDNNLDGIMDTNGYPRLEKTGDDGSNGFGYATGSGLLWDYAANGTGAQLGNYFLRTTAVSSENGTETLMVSYINPVQKASGEIWDVDSIPAKNITEQWNIDVLGENGTLLKTIVTPPGPPFDATNSLDGLPMPFEVVADEGTAIHALRFVFSGVKSNYIGLAFNNFSPAEGLGTTNVIGVARICPATEIYWYTQVGNTYQLQWSAGLGKQWHNLGAPVTGTGSEVSELDSTRNTKNRIYRVLEIN